MERPIQTSSHPKSMVVYDGSCRICQGSLKWLNYLDWFKKFESLPYQVDEVYHRFPKLVRQDYEKALHVILPDGRIYAGADAFRQIFLRMPATWILGVLMMIPPMPWIFRRLYPILAHYRYHLRGSCRVETNPDRKER